MQPRKASHKVWSRNTKKIRKSSDTTRPSNKKQHLVATTVLLVIVFRLMVNRTRSWHWKKMWGNILVMRLKDLVQLKKKNTSWTAFSILSLNSLQSVGVSLFPFMCKALCGVVSYCFTFTLPILHSGYFFLFSFVNCPDIIHAYFTELSGVCAMWLSASCFCLSSSAMILDFGKIRLAIPRCQRVDRPLDVYERGGLDESQIG